jgi:DUF971 family protein
VVRSMSETIKPTGITANRQTQELALQWNDGHESVYTFSLLRYACPCAECQGGHENMRLEPDEKIFALPIVDSPDTRITNVEAVGTYAITIAWEDGHHYGIYTWEYLRKLCSCPVCHPESNDV